MASATDPQQEFLSTYAPLAQKVGDQLGVDPNIVLGQWAHETGYGSNQGTKHNNLGGFTAQDGNYLSYDSPEQFADHYITTLKAKYPGAVGSGSDASKFSAALQQGGYFRGDPNLSPAQNLANYTAGVTRGAQLASSAQPKDGDFSTALYGPERKPALSGDKSTPSAAATPPADDFSHALYGEIPTKPTTATTASQGVPPQVADQSVTSAEPPSWYQRNIGMPVASMMRPDLTAGQGQNYLLGAPVLQSVGAGIVQGTRNVAQTLSNFAEYENALHPGLAAIDRSMGFPDKSTLPQQTEAFRKQYPSDTAASVGEVAGNIGTTAPAGLVARGAGAVAEALPVINRLAPAVSGAVGGAIQNVLTSPEEAWKTALATGAAGGAVVGQALNQVGRWFGGLGGNAARQAEQEAADRLGIRLSAGQRAGQDSVANRVEDTTKILPGSGAAKFAEEQRQDITRVLGRESGIPGDVARMDTNVVNDGFTRAGQRIENAAQRITVPADTTLMGRLAQIETASQQAGTATAQANTVRNLNNELVNLMSNNGNRLPGPEFQRFIARGGSLDTALNSSVPEVRSAATAIREALLDGAQRGGQGSAEALRDLGQGRYQWKVLSTIAPAIQRTQGGTDEMSLPALANAIRREFDMRATGAGNAMQDLSRLISGPLRTLASSGTAERGAWQSWLGLGGAGPTAGGLAYMLGSPHAAEIAAATTAIPLAANVTTSRLLRYGPGMGINPLEAARQEFNPLMPRILGPSVGNALIGQ